MTRCALSMGGNLGDVSATMRRARHLIAAMRAVTNVRVSRLYRTTPMGASAGGPFLNAAVVLDTSLSPLELLDRLQEIERECGRVRTIRWGPRTLDLDLIFYGEDVVQVEDEGTNAFRLIVPHPAMWHRRFVLDPLVELIPDAVHPVFGLTLTLLRARLLPRPLPVCWLGPQGVVPFDAGVDFSSAMLSEVEWLPPEEAAIVFATADAMTGFPHVVRVPEEPEGARQRVKDVLTAALDEPAAISEGGIDG